MVVVGAAAEQRPISRDLVMADRNIAYSLSRSLSLSLSLSLVNKPVVLVLVVVIYEFTDQSSLPLGTMVSQPNKAFVDEPNPFVDAHTQKTIKIFEGEEEFLCNSHTAITCF